MRKDIKKNWKTDIIILKVKVITRHGDTQL
jgi:hypothetical protein